MPVIRLVLKISPVLALLAIWYVATSLGMIKPFLLPSPQVVAMRLWRDITSGQFALNAGLTMYRALVGFAIACLIGVPAGMLIASDRFVRWFCEPLISVGFPMPKIAFLPVFMLWPAPTSTDT